MSVKAHSSVREPRSGVAPIKGSLADWLVSELLRIGIDTYFGVPGGAAEALFSALARQQRAGNIEVIPMRSEAGAAFAADGYYRASGRMAACVTTTGPGVTNLCTAALASYADRVPVLLLTPQAPLSRLGRGAFQDCWVDPLAPVKLLANCSRFSAAITHVAQLPYALGQAWHFSHFPPVGPVHINIAADLLAGAFPERAPLPPCANLPPSTCVDERALASLVELLVAAKSPVFYVGDDAGPAASELCRLASELGGSVVSSPAGKRWLNHLDPVYLGVVGFAGHSRAIDAVDGSDLIITFGATFDEFSTNGWSVFCPSKVHAIDRHATFAYRQPGIHFVLADAPSFVARMATRRHPCEEKRVERVPLPPALAQGGAGDSVHPLELMRWIGARAGSDVVVHVETGNSMAWATRGLYRTRPDTYRVAMGACSMGWAIAASIGAAVAQRKRVICLTGDGAMLMSSLELTVAVERNLPVTWIVLNDSSLGMVRHGQRMNGAEPIGTYITPVAFALLAQACGMTALRVDVLEELDRVPLDWLRSAQGGPRLLDVVVDREAVPPIAARLAAIPRESAQP